MKKSLYSSVHSETIACNLLSSIEIVPTRIDHQIVYLVVTFQGSLNTCLWHTAQSFQPSSGLDKAERNFLKSLDISGSKYRHRHALCYTVKHKLEQFGNSFLAQSSACFRSRNSRQKLSRSGLSAQKQASTCSMSGHDYLPGWVLKQIAFRTA